MTSQPGDRRSAFSRGEIENLCLLSAIPQNGCALSELPVLLGLSPQLKEPVAEAITPLINAGWLREIDGRLTVSPEGRAWVKERMTEQE